jgi:transposase
MVAPSRCVRKPLRQVRIPLPEGHPDWLELDRAVDKDSPARLIRYLVEQIDLSGLFDSFARVGSAVTPPDLLLQVVLYEIHHKKLSPVIWFGESRDSAAVRWLLRGLRPSLSVFYRFRKHLPLDLVDTLNQQILLWAQAEGHTTASAAALDGTFHAAAGSRHHLLNLEDLDQRCGQLDAFDAPAPAAGQTAQASAAAPPAPPLLTPPAAQASATGPPAPPLPAASADAAGAGSVRSGADEATGPASAQGLQPTPASNPTSASSPTAAAAPAATERPAWMARTRAGRQQQRRRCERARQTLKTRLANHDKKQRRQRKVKRRTAEQVKISPCEPEAVLGKDKLKVFRPLYNTQIVQDVDSPFVLGYGVYARVSDAGLLPPMLERTRQLTGRGLEELLVDGIYARLLDVRYCVEHGTQMLAPLPAPGQPKRDKSKRKSKSKKSKEKAKAKEVLLGKEAFTWLPQERTYKCPQGHLLQLERRCAEERRDGERVMVEQYRCAADHCQKCPQAGGCTKRPDKGRTIKRLEGQELLDEVGARTQTPEGKQRYKKRSQTVERRHADFKQHRGLRRFPAYGLGHAQSLIALMVLVHNGLTLLDARQTSKKKMQETNSPQ